MNKEPKTDTYPLSPMQEGMLFHPLSQPLSALYFEQWGCRLEGRLDVPAFRRAWDLVVERHPVLRSSFVEMKLLPKAPDMQKLYTEAFLPSAGAH